MKKNLADNSHKTYRILSIMFLLCLALLFSFPLSAEAAGRLNKKNLSLAKGTSYILKVKGTKKKMKWSSSNPKVARVNGKGKVTAKKAGKATITAKTGTKSYRCRVTVDNAKLNRKSASILAGSSYTFKVTGTNRKVTWSSSNPQVAAVQNGKVTGKKAGTVTITAKVGDSSLKAKLKVFKNSNSNNDDAPYNDDSDNDDEGNGGSSGNDGYSPSNPSDPEYNNPVLNQTSITVKVGESYQLSVSGTSQAVTWMGNDASVATVVNGLVTGISPGSTGVDVKVGNQMLFCYITVIQNVEEDVRAIKSEMSTLIAKAEKINNNSHQYSSSSFKAFQDNLAAAKAAYQGNDLEKLNFWLNWLRDYEITATVPQQLTYYPTVSKKIFDDINAYRKSLGIEPLSWSEGCLKRARVQAGYNCLNVDSSLLSNYSEYSKLANHAYNMCGYGISAVGTFRDDAARKAGVSSHPHVLGTANTWATSPTHKLMLQTTYTGANTKPYGAVAVYTYNNDDGATFVSIVFATDGFDRYFIPGTTVTYQGYTVHNWNNVANDLTPQILNCKEIK